MVVHRRWVFYFLVLAFLAQFTARCVADTLRITVPLLPPMAVPDGTGHEQKIMAETLARCGHLVNFILYPFGTHWRIYADDLKGEGNGALSLDAVSTIPPGLTLPGEPSRDYIQYQNGVSVLENSGPVPLSLADLSGRKVVAFADARVILPGLEQAIPSFSGYVEKADQMAHATLLFGLRVDAILSDGLIAAEYNRKLRSRANAGERFAFDSTQNVRFHALFPPSPYHMVFRKRVHRDEFDRCLADMITTGRIAALMGEAVSTYREFVGDQYLGY